MKKTTKESILFWLMISAPLLSAFLRNWKVTLGIFILVFAIQEFICRVNLQGRNVRKLKADLLKTREHLK